MSSAACISLGPTPLSHLKNVEKGAAAFNLASVRGRGFRPSPNALFLRIPSRPSRRKPSPRRTAVRPFSPVMEWQDCRYSNEPSLAHLLVLQDKPDLSRWALKYEVFGRDVEFSWLARNLQVRANFTSSTVRKIIMQQCLCSILNTCFLCCSPFLIRKYIGDLWKVFLIGMAIS
ncbi:hypothetical protein GW17_00034075 [Ensete ventricosum]|nr:hypothetical protein GW17_00034075 [Ensete ventricosum]